MNSLQQNTYNRVQNLLERCIILRNDFSFDETMSKIKDAISHYEATKFREDLKNKILDNDMKQFS